MIKVKWNGQDAELRLNLSRRGFNLIVGGESVRFIPMDVAVEMVKSFPKDFIPEEIRQKLNKKTDN